MPVLRLKGPYNMPTTINADGSATYSITIPAPLTVTREPGAPGHSGAYHAGGATVAADWADLNGDGWATHIAGLIAIQDRAQHDFEATRQSTLDALAGALYTADIVVETAPIEEQPAFAELPDDAAAGYHKRALVLDSLGVELGGKGNGKGGADND